MSETPPSHPQPFGAILLGFLVHLAAWSAFVGLKAASESFMAGDGPLVALLLPVLAWVAGAAAILTARGLPRIPRMIVAIVSIVVFGLAGLAEVGFRFLPFPDDSALWLLLAPFAYIGILVFPFVLAGTLAVVVGRSRVLSANAAPRLVGYVLPGSAVLLCLVLVVAGGVAFTFGGFWYWMNWVLAACAAGGATAALILLDRLTAAAVPAAVVSGARAGVFVVVLTGMHLCIFSVVQAIYADWSGIFGALVWAVAIFGFAAGALAVLVALGASLRDSDAPEPEELTDLSEFTEPL